MSLSSLQCTATTFTSSCMPCTLCCRMFCRLSVTEWLASSPFKYWSFYVCKQHFNYSTDDNGLEILDFMQCLWQRMEEDGEKDWQSLDEWPSAAEWQMGLSSSLRVGRSRVLSHVCGVIQNIQQYHFINGLETYRALPVGSVLRRPAACWRTKLRWEWGIQSPAIQMVSVDGTILRLHSIKVLEIASDWQVCSVWFDSAVCCVCVWDGLHWQRIHYD